MRSFFLRWRLAILLGGNFVYADLSAAIIQWDGGGADGQWNTATNWVGNVLPAPGDDVLLNNIFLGGTYTVALPAGAITITINSLIISPAGANTITVILPAANTANPGLLITGPGDALVLNSNARLENSSGAAAGSGVSITNTFRINNGGYYVHNTGRQNAPIVSQLSAVAGTEFGVVEFNVPLASYFLSLSGRIFGSLVLNAIANGGTATYLGSGASPLTVRGYLTINSGVMFSLSMSADVIVSGDFTQQSASTFDIQTLNNNNSVRVAGNFYTYGIITESGTGTSLVELNGTAQQLVDGTGSSFTNSVEFRLNNPGGASLIGPMSIAYVTSIQAGNFLLNSFDLQTNILNSISPPTPTTNHVVTNGLGELVINVPAATPTIFPIGPSISTYNPITITSPGTTNFAARVEIGINPAIAFPTYGINRTWNIRAPVITMANVNVIFQYASADANGGAVQPQDMEILMFSGVAWSILPGNANITPGGANPAWTIATTSPITIPTTATPFALGVDGGWILPLDCIIFSKGRRSNNAGVISWTVNSCTQVISFELEKANERGIFESYGKILPTASVDYEMNVGELPVGRSQYRVRINKTNGTTKYSNIVLLVNEQADFSASIRPTIIKENGTILISMHKNENLRFYISNASGQLLKKWQMPLMAGENKIEVNAAGFARGIYFIMIQSGSTSQLIKFLRD